MTEFKESYLREAVTFNVPRGAALLTYQQAIIYVVSFAYYVLLIRILNLSQVGEVSLLLAAMSIFTALTQLALPLAATRFISANIGSGNPATAGAVAKTSLRLMLAVSGPALLISILTSPLIGSLVFKSSNSISLLFVTFGASFLLDLTTLYGAYFLGVGRYHAMVYQNVLFVTLSRGLGLGLAYRGLGPLGIPLGWMVGALATLFLSLRLWKGNLPAYSTYPVKPLLAFSLPLFASAVIALLQGWGDIALLQGILGQFGTTGAYYIVISSVAFLSILWSPAVGALYPALSSSYHSNGPSAVSAKLGVATRLVNLTVLPAGAALAAIAPTALEAVYGCSLGNQAIPFAILAVTIIFSAQAFLLITTLQAVGRTKHILGISLIATLIDLAVVGLGATAIGTTAGAMGRGILAAVTMLLAWVSLRKLMLAPITNGLAKGIPLTLFSSSSLLIVDYSLRVNLRIAPLSRILVLIGVFGVLLLVTSRMLSIFTAEDFDMVETAFPRFLKPYIATLEKILVPKSKWPSHPNV